MATRATGNGSLVSLAFTAGFFVFLAVDVAGTTKFAVLCSVTAMVIVVVCPFIVAVVADNTPRREQTIDPADIERLELLLLEFNRRWAEQANSSPSLQGLGEPRLNDEYTFVEEALRRRNEREHGDG